MQCNICGSDEIRKTKNDEIYGRIYGRGDIFLCDNCRSYVGCHPDGRPLGLLANREMRDLKVKCHSLFDPIWKNKEVPRGKLYGRLSNILKINKKDCHFGHFDVDMLNECLSIFQDEDWYKC